MTSPSILWGYALLGCAFSLLPNIGLAQDINDAEQKVIRSVVETLNDSVVQIETVGGLQPDGQIEGGSRTSGTIVSEDGYILTSAFLLAMEPSGILVTLPTGERLAATLVAKDTHRNLALLKVESMQPLSVPTAANRDELKPGQWCIALGKVFSPKQASVSVGILSATHRVWSKAVQTDAKISPNNYGGPLADIHGNVIGILTPLSPQSDAPSAGLEWYDSGIGFAVPLSETLEKLDTLKQGTDLKRGLLGISLQGKDIIADPAEVGMVQYNSPAQQAGLQKGDIVVFANGIAIERQAQFKHVLGTLYAGETIELKVQRGDETLDVSVELADHLVPYERPYLGILPTQDPANPSPVVRYVIQDSPAAAAGVKVGDTVTSYDDQEAKDTATLREAVATAEPNVKHQLKVRRGEQDLTFSIQPTSIPNEFLSSIPAPKVADDATIDEAIVIGENKFQLAEEQNEAKLFVPEIAQKLPSLGLMVLLDDAEFPIETHYEAWKDQAKKDGFAVLSVQPANQGRWTRPESAVIRKLIDKVRGSYPIDENRTVVAGGKTGGAMALLHGFENREVQSGAVAVEATIPRGVSIPDNEPLYRLEIVLATADGTPADRQAKQQIERLRELKFRVIHEPLSSPVSPTTLINKIATWINGLDRI